MKKLITLVCFAFLLNCVFVIHSFSQAWQYTSKAKDIGYIAVGGHVGIINYFGDLNPRPRYVSTDIRGTRPTIGIDVTRKLSPRIMVRAAASWGRVVADDFIAADPNDERDKYRFMRNSHFRNDIYELSMVMTYDLIASPFVYYKRAKFTPYLLAGVAGFYHNPRAKTPEDMGNNWVALRPLSTEGQGLTRSVDSRPGAGDAGTSYGKKYSLFQPSVPVGAGVRFKLTDRIDFSVEVAYRILFTDYIDDVSGNYANPIDLPSDLSRAMANRTTETTAARKGDDRTQYITSFVNGVGPDFIGNPTINGYGNDGDKRGERSNFDELFITAFHINYIIGVGLKCPTPKYRR